MSKNKIVKFILITVLSVVLVLSAIFVYFFASTMSVDGCIKYCRENSDRGATNFEIIMDGRYINDYAYFIAADGESSKSQEIFVFRRKYLGSVFRYKFVMSNTQSSYGMTGENEIGSIQFLTNNDKGEEEPDSTLLFFGAIKDSDILEYEYSLTVREGTNVYRGTVKRFEDVWFLKFCGLRDTNEPYKKIVSDVKFYDSKGDLVGIY